MEVVETKDELMKKFDLLRKLKMMEELHGIKLSQSFTLKSDYNEMLLEYEEHTKKLSEEKQQNQKRFIADLLKHFLEKM